MCEPPTPESLEGFANTVGPDPNLDILMSQNLCMMKFETHFTKVRLHETDRAGETGRQVTSLVESLLFLRSLRNIHRDGFYEQQIIQGSSSVGRRGLRLFSLGVNSF